MRKPSELFEVAAVVWKALIERVEEEMLVAAGRGEFRYMKDCVNVEEREALFRIFSKRGYVVETVFDGRGEGLQLKIVISW